MIGAVLVLAMLAAPAEQCAILMPHSSGSGFTYQPAPGFSVLAAVPPLQLPSGFDNAVGIGCGRETLVISDNDFGVVLDLKMPMYIGGGGVMGVLEMADGQFQFRLIRGVLSEEQKAMVQAALDRGQTLARER